MIRSRDFDFGDAFYLLDRMIYGIGAPSWWPITSRQKWRIKTMTRGIKPSTDEYSSLDSEDDYHSGSQKVSHQQVSLNITLTQTIIQDKQLILIKFKPFAKNGDRIPLIIIEWFNHQDKLTSRGRLGLHFLSCWTFTPNMYSCFFKKFLQIRSSQTR